jgi:hypothetical protein
LWGFAAQHPTIDLEAQRDEMTRNYLTGFYNDVLAAYTMARKRLDGFSRLIPVGREFMKIAFLMNMRQSCWAWKIFS